MGIKNTLHPTFGTKGKPSAVPPAFAGNRHTLRAQTRPRRITASPGQPYLRFCDFRRRLLGESPFAAHTEIPPAPRSLKCKPTKGSPIAAFEYYGSIIPPEFSFCKCFDKISLCLPLEGEAARRAGGVPQKNHSQATAQGRLFTKPSPPGKAARREAGRKRGAMGGNCVRIFDCFRPLCPSSVRAAPCQLPRMGSFWPC